MYLKMFNDSVEWRRFTGTDTQLFLSNQSQMEKRQGRARELLTLHDSCSQAKHKVLQRLHRCLRHCMNSCQSSTPPLLASMSSLNNSSTLIVVAHSSSCSSIYRRAGSCFDSVPVSVFTIRALPSPRRLPPPSTALCSFIYVSHPSRALSSPLLAQFLSVSTTRSQPPPPPTKPTMTTDPPQQPTSQHEPTNTLALLLPHPTLFAPPVLDLLRAHYAHFGRIAHWAPVKGFGRVIVVFGSEEEAENAKRQGDWLKLDVPVGGEEKVDGEEKSKEAEYVERSGRFVVK